MQSLSDASGKRVHYLQCPLCGVAKVEDEQLRKWKWQNESIIQEMAKLFSPPGNVVVLVPDQAWILGRLVLGQRRPSLIMVRSQQALNELRTIEWLNQNNSVVVLFPNQYEAASWNKQAIILSEVIQLEENQLELKDAWRLLLSESIGQPSEGRKPERKRRDVRTRNIETIVNFLIDFMRKRKVFAQAAFDASGTSELLPGLRQKDICDATGLKKSTVSKCLNDTKSKVLQALWSVSQSEDVRECLKFKLPSSKASSINQQQHEMIDSIGD